MTDSPAGPPADVVVPLRALEQRLAGTTLPLDLPGVGRARARRRSVTDQLRDYVLPRAERRDAPLLAVVGGSTGAGKSTLVNPLVGQAGSRAPADRPHTPRPGVGHR